MNDRPNAIRSAPPLFTTSEAAMLIAQACGPAGSCAEYLHRTVWDLADRSMYDRNLWQLQELVAARLRIIPKT
ncbi:cation transport regulator ChaC [Rhizobium tibeticum]|nr:cation transport regulator ChaC [Rhizobium tibeticum]